MIDYASFAATSVAEVKMIQDKFQRDYNLTWYEDWSYDQYTGLLTFTSSDKELNFRFFNVGSFSEKSKTWKWSWANESTLDSIKGPARLIREFGQRSNFPKFTDTQFESNEIEAWEFTAIAAKLTNGIGVYRPIGDAQLKLFLVISEYVDNEAAQKIKDRYVECRHHDYARRAFVCKHLNHTTKVGFQEAFETAEGMELSEEDDFQAWCDECEVVRKKEGEWNDKSMALAEIQLVCEHCYFEMKELNLGHR